MADVRFYQVVIDCGNPGALAEFWSGFTGYEVTRVYDDWATIAAEDGSARVGFQQVPEGKLVRTGSTSTRRQGRGSRGEGDRGPRRYAPLGERGSEDPFVVFADPEGNEFCIVRDE